MKIMALRARSARQWQFAALSLLLHQLTLKCQDVVNAPQVHP